MCVSVCVRVCKRKREREKERERERQTDRQTDRGERERFTAVSKLHEIAICPWGKQLNELSEISIGSDK